MSDLHIKTDILPAFDRTHNQFAREELEHILLTPLNSVTEITERQSVLKGFEKNLPILHEFTYSSLDFQDVYHFTFAVQNSSDLPLKLHFSRALRDRAESKVIQLIMLFHRWEATFSRLDIKAFPPAYSADIAYLQDFIQSYQPSKYQKIIREKRLSRKILAMLTQHIASCLKNNSTHIFWSLFFRFEAYMSISIAAGKMNMCYPVFNGEKIDIRRLSHPLLSGGVPNNFKAEHSLLLLTGANMSGKSTFLRALSICVYMAHTGLPVCAERCTMPYFDDIFVRLHHRDDFSKGYSHFLSDVLALKEALLSYSAGKRCFAVFDELFNGTSIEDALVILTSTINSLSAFTRSYFCISTHINELQQLPVVKDRLVDAYYLECAVIDAEPHFSYLLKQGWSDLRIGQILFDQQGLNELLNKLHQKI